MKEDVLAVKLEQLGLRQGEAAVYVALLKAGRCSVRKIKELTGFHRTGIYDFLEQLINRGLVNYITEGNCKYYSPNSPEKFQELINEKQEALHTILPVMHQYLDTPRDDLTVEVAKGKEAIKALLADALRIGENYICIGIDEEWWDSQFPIITEQHMKKEIRTGIHWKAITFKNTKFVYDTKQAEYRFLPQEHFGPLHTIVYGDNVAIVIREPLSVITIRNKALADAQRTQFNFLWKIADKQ